MNRQSGFTLIELITVIVIGALLLTVGIPSFIDIIQRNRVVTEANAFVTALSSARTEAVKLNIPVTLCRSADGVSCATTGHWDQGWIMFTDIDSNENLTTADCDPTQDCILRVGSPLEGGMTLEGNTNIADAITFANTGSVFGANNGTFTLCPQDDTHINGKSIVVARTGRTSIDDIPKGSCP